MRPTPLHLRATLGLAALALLLAVAPAGAGDDWVERSDANTALLLEVQARFSPEGAGRIGVEGLDEEITRLSLDRTERVREALGTVRVELVRRAAEEEHRLVAQDLEILVDAIDETLRGIELEERHELPYFDVAQTVFQGLRALLDERVPEERRPAALVRLRRYAGLEEGYEPIAVQAERTTRAHLDDAGLRAPFVDELEKDLANGSRFVGGIGELFAEHGLEGYEEAYAALKKQLSAYEEFVRAEILPRAATDFRLPEEQYRFRLAQSGIDMPVEELTGRAKVAFREIQNEMRVLARLIAEERELPSADYRDVLRHLKGEQLVGEEILPHYEQRIAQLEELIREHDVVTLPERDMKIRLASEAESAAIPAPHMSPPRLIGNTGEMGHFVLPLRIPDDSGEGELSLDDFTFDAASWTLTVHEGRPGHELQFASIVEQGISQARVLYALNSVNVEGWALYAEAEMKPLMPLDGQLVGLQHRLLRAARAFLDPGLQLGDIDRDTAYRVLEEDVVMSHGAALQEVERYTFWAPGQAPSYFCGYVRLMELRADVERLLADGFDRAEFHDFVLAQGVLPPAMLREAVMERFVEPRLQATSSG